MAKDLVYDSLNTRDKSIFDLKTGTNGKSVLPNHEIARRLGVSAAFISQRSLLIATQIQDARGRHTPFMGVQDT